MFDYTRRVVWRSAWKIQVTWESPGESPSDEATQTIDVAGVAQLRRIVLALRADPRVRTYRYWLHPVWQDDGEIPPRQCRRRHAFLPGRAGVAMCRCGTGHFSWHCWCGDTGAVPPTGPGCGPVPFDPEAGRHHW